MSSLRDAVLVVNRDGDVVLANPPMLELLELGEDEALMRPARELLGGGALAPLWRAAGGAGQGPDRSPARPRRSGLHGQHRHLRGRRRRSARPHPHPERHQRGAAPGHGEAEVHPHDGARAQEPARLHQGPARGRDRQEPRRGPRPLLPLVARADHRIDNLVAAHPRPADAGAQRAGAGGRGARARPGRLRPGRGRGARPRARRPARASP